MTVIYIIGALGDDGGGDRLDLQTLVGTDRTVDLPTLVGMERT